VRHLITVEIGLGHPTPTALLQIGPDLTRGVRRHRAVDALLGSDDGEHLYVVVKDDEAGPARGGADAGSQPFLSHDVHSCGVFEISHDQTSGAKEQ